jgi:hypothetical protein
LAAFKAIKKDLASLVEKKQVGYQADADEILKEQGKGNSYEDPNETKRKAEEAARKEAEKKAKAKDKK